MVLDKEATVLCGPEYIQHVVVDSQKHYGYLEHSVKLPSTRIMNDSYVRIRQMELFSTLLNYTLLQRTRAILGSGIGHLPKLPALSALLLPYYCYYFNLNVITFLCFVSLKDTSSH